MKRLKIRVSLDAEMFLQNLLLFSTKVANEEHARTANLVQGIAVKLLTV